jgi:hypothetical protein
VIDFAAGRFPTAARTSAPVPGSRTQPICIKSTVRLFPPPMTQGALYFICGLFSGLGGNFLGEIDCTFPDSLLGAVEATKQEGRQLRTGGFLYL